MIENKASLSVIEFPNGKFGYVGSVPLVLGSPIPASKSAIMGGRSYVAEDGNSYEWKFPNFDTQEEALTFARNKGFEPKTPIPAS